MREIEKGRREECVRERGRAEKKEKACARRREEKKQNVPLYVCVCV